MIYDCFQFFNELDILKIRLNTLNNVVDKFVICESTVTFSGENKPLYYKENKELYKEFEDKIIHVIVEDTPDVNPFERDVFQKNAVKRGLINCSEDDVIIFSDLDEIPNPEKIKECINNIEKNKVYHFAQRNYYYYLNLEEISGELLSFSGEFDEVKDKKWLGTKMCTFSYIKNREIGILRHPEQKNNGVRIDDGGWHFSYMGGDKTISIEERIANKIKSAAHQEYNNQKILGKLKNKIEGKKDLFGRKSKFKVVSLDNSFPNYLLENKVLYSHLIYEEKKNKFLSFFRGVK
ncbi:MAG: glycosyl transferase GT17 family protein [Fusobacteriaceae bacterium]|nr:glycosyl transferase GT17 family protein [Fusobacteriaceae bacterium]